MQRFDVVIFLYYALKVHNCCKVKLQKITEYHVPLENAPHLGHTYVISTCTIHFYNCMVLHCYTFRIINPPPLVEIGNAYEILQ